jgi:hypothetical protein
MGDGIFSNADKAKCARREVGLRRRAYPRWVANGTLTQAAADREIAMMQEIADDLARLAEADRQRETPTLL